MGSPQGNAAKLLWVAYVSLRIKTANFWLLRLLKRENETIISDLEFHECQEVLIPVPLYCGHVFPASCREQTAQNLIGKKKLKIFVAL